MIFSSAPNDWLMHHGIKGQKWGIRRYQNPDGTLTEEGKKRYSFGDYSNTKVFSLGIDGNNKNVKKIAEEIGKSEGFNNLIKDYVGDISNIKDPDEAKVLVNKVATIIKTRTYDSLGEVADKKVTDLSMNPAQALLTMGGYISFSSKTGKFGDKVTNELYDIFNKTMNGNN